MKRKSIGIVLLSALSPYAMKATSDNIAPLAQITASSSMEGYEASRAIDGIIRVFDQGEWRSQSQTNFYGQIEYPSLTLQWEKPYTIGEILLYDRPDPDSHLAGGILHFSDGSELKVFEIPNDGSPKSIKFPAKTVEWVKFESTDADGLHPGLSEIEVYTAKDSRKDFVSKVDPYIESARGRYFFFVTGSQPFGMISAAPLTRNKNQYGGGYNYNSTEVLGFPQIHDWMLSGVTLMPTTGKVDPTQGEQGWKSPFRHEGEIVRPGFHRMFLERYQLWVEQTASDRVSFYRLTYTGKEDNILNLLLNLGGYVSTSTMFNADVRKTGDREIVGSVDTGGRLWGGPERIRIYYALRFDKAMGCMDGWDGTQRFQDTDRLKGTGTLNARNEGMSYYDAPTSGVSLKYPVATGDTVLVKCAISYTSAENALANLDSELTHWNFDQACADSRAEWNRYLGRIEVKGGTEAQQTKFYTDLWHVLLGRHKIDDTNGCYPDYTDGTRQGSQTVNVKYHTRTLPKNNQGRARFHMYSSDAFWLTQWNLNILWGLAWPEVQDNFAACLVQYARNGGLLPCGPVAGGYSYIMTTCPATPLITSAYQKGILTKVPAQEAFCVMASNHRGGGMMGSTDEIRDYERLGYFPGHAGNTMEAAFQDWALGQMALKMGKKKEARYYDRRSHGWTALLHPEKKLVFPKSSNGEWLHTDGLSGWGWTESNAWQATWSVSHDIDRLADMIGEKKEAARMLNHAFEQAAPQSFVFGYTDGYVSYANQPGCSNAHVFNHLDAPRLCQYWVRQVNEKAYGATTPDKGYGGHDEDQGQMGGVSALMSIGLFSLTGTCDTHPYYDITSPVFDEIIIHLSPDYYTGKDFRIKTYHNSAENCYIGKKLFNGQPLADFRISHKDLTQGGLLELWMEK